MAKNKYLHDGERLDDLQYRGLFIIQDPKKYCFSSDATKLANFVKCKRGGRMVDLCSGSGVVGILAKYKTGAGHCTLVEIQPDMADMCTRSLAYNGIEDDFTVINQPLQGVHALIGCDYDVVMCNPPYRKANEKILNESENIRISRHEICVTIEDVMVECKKLLKYGGSLYLVCKEDRLVDIITYARENGLEPKELVLDLSAGGTGQLLIRCVRGGKSGIKISLYREN